MSDAKPIIEDAARHPWTLGCRTCQREAEEALADRDRELEEARQALAAAVVPLEVIAGQHRVKPYRELSPGLVERVNTSIAVIRAALGKDEG